MLPMSGTLQCCFFSLSPAVEGLEVLKSLFHVSIPRSYIHVGSSAFHKSSAILVKKKKLLYQFDTGNMISLSKIVRLRVSNCASIGEGVLRQLGNCVLILPNLLHFV